MRRIKINLVFLFCVMTIAYSFAADETPLSRREQYAQRAAQKAELKIKQKKEEIALLEKHRDLRKKFDSEKHTHSERQDFIVGLRNEMKALKQQYRQQLRELGKK